MVCVVTDLQVYLAFLSSVCLVAQGNWVCKGFLWEGTGFVFTLGYRVGKPVIMIISSEAQKILIISYSVQEIPKGV